jgi:hypothetical protein
MVETRIRKKKMKSTEPYEPPEDRYGVILTINDSQEMYKGYEWFEDFREKGETIYSSFGILSAYGGQPVYIYLISQTGIVADAKIGSDEDLERIKENYDFTDIDSNKATPLINLRLIDHPIDKDELIELGIFKKVPRILKYISKDEYKAIESLFED